MIDIRREASRFSKYGIVGVANNLFLYVVFLLLVAAGARPILASGGCYVLGVCTSYLLNRRYAFQSRSSHSRDLPRFVAAYLVGLASTMATMAVLLHWLSPAAAQLLNILVTACVIYVTLRVLNFGGEYHGSAG